MNSSEFDKSDQKEDMDDLQTIKGIGKSIAQALNDIGIQSYTDLAAYDPDQLLDILGDKLPPIALRKASPEAWIEQARLLASDQRTDEQIYPEKSPAGVSEPDENNSTKVLARPGWREIADFFISFGYEDDEKGEMRLMTRAHHSQADQQMQWQGIVSKELLQWLGEQARLPLHEGESEPSKILGEDAVAQEELQDAIEVKLNNLWVSEVRVPVGSSPGTEANLLRVNSNLVLKGQESEGYVQERLEFAVDILLVDTDSNQPTLVGTYNSRLRPGELAYGIQQDFQVPRPGRYQLYLMARVPPPAEPVKFVQGPIIVVED